MVGCNFIMGFIMGPFPFCQEAIPIFPIGRYRSRNGACKTWCEN
jgi:hypothetical protein